ncbi:unnamed protein product [Rotaria magnacalcarata]
MASATTSDENIDDEIMGQMVTSLEASTAEDRKKNADYLQENGVASYAQFLKGRLEGWKEYPLRIALTDSSGQGNHSVCFK